MILTADERVRFAGYLERKALDSLVMAEQLKKMGVTKITGSLIQKLEAEAAHCKAVAQILTGTQES